MDKTGASYYGEQTLHYLAVNGETALVQLGEFRPLLPHFYSVVLGSGAEIFTL